MRTISDLFNVVAILVLVICIIAGIVLFASIKGGMGFVVGVLVAAGGAVQWLFFKATAEALIVLVDIEHNTRVAANSVARRV